MKYIGLTEQDFNELSQLIINLKYVEAFPIVEVLKKSITIEQREEEPADNE